MKSKILAFRMGIVALGALLVTSACSSATAGGDTSGAAGPRETLTIATGAIRSMDPVRQYDQPSLWVNGLALEGLIKLDAAGKIEPALAESYENPDPTTYVYTLRQGVKFWNGAEVTTEDVVYSLKRYQDQTAQTASKYKSVASIEATGPLEVTVKLKEPDSSWQYTPAYAGQIIEKKFAEAHPTDLGGPGVLTMGTGPWMPTEFNSSAGMTLVKNDNWWGADEAGKEFEESWETVKLVFAASVPAAAALRAGDVDGVVGTDGTAFAGSNAEITSAPTETLGYVTLLTDSGPLADVHVRRALAHLLDRPAIVASALKGFGDPATEMTSKRVWTDLPKDQVDAAYAQIPTYEYNLDAAKKELDQSGYPNGVTIVAETISTYPSFVRTTEILKEAAAKIGITIDIQGVPGAQWLTDSTDHKIELTVSTYSSLSPDPNFYPNTLMRADGLGAGGSNYANLAAPGLDDFVHAASAAPAQSQEQLMAVVGALKANAEQVGYIPVYTQKAVFAHDAKISFDGFSQYSMGTPYPLQIK